MTLNIFDITSFGAIADGKTDCTKAIQAALDEAGKVGGEVLIPPGTFLCGYVRVPRNVMLRGTYSWTFDNFGGSILKLNDKDAPCLLDITAGFGCCIDGVCLDGANLEGETHGVFLNWENRLESRKAYNGREDTPTITNCRIGCFSGDAVHYNNVWCFTIRNSMLCYSRYGLFVNGCDAFITDNWFSFNRLDGIYAERFMAATFTGNRIECNWRHGISMFDCGAIQFSNNYFDGNVGHNFYSADEGEDFRGNINFTGNFFYRAGYSYPKYNISGMKDAAHLYIAHATNIAIVGNSFVAGSSSNLCPAYSLIIKQLRSSVITNNTFMYGAVKQNLVDLGGHKEDVIISSNVGLDSLSTTEKTWPRFED